MYKQHTNNNSEPMEIQEQMVSGTWFGDIPNFIDFFFLFNICTNLRLKITLDVMKLTRSLRMVVLEGNVSSQRRKAIRGINVT